MVETSKKYISVSVTMPKQLLHKLNKYCDSVMKGSVKIRSAVIRQAIEEFLSRQGGN